MRRLLIATDAWHPQVNGVVRSLQHMVAAGPGLGFDTVLLTHQDFRSLPLPGYPEIRLAHATRRKVAARWDGLAPTHVHVATEGTVGYATRRHCLARGRPFTTSYHTRFPEYLAARLPVPEAWSYAWLRRFHGPACGTMVSTPSLERELVGRGFSNLMRWTRGVDTELFRPAEPGEALPAELADLPRPLFLFVGRLAVEKNVEAFLRSTCRAAASSSATGRTGRGSRRWARARASSARARAPPWRGSTPAPTSSSSRASPTPSASCCSRRWPAARRSRPSRSPARST